MAEEENRSEKAESRQPETDAPQVQNTPADSTENELEHMFFGSYDHSIDGKGRIIIPAGYRDALGDRFTIGPTRDLQAVALYPRHVWLKLLKEFQSMNQRKLQVQQYIHQFTKLSYPDGESDNQGRLLLPSKLRSRMLGEAKDVEISGAFDHIRIVDSQRAAKEDQDFLENIPELLQYLGDLEA